MLLYLKLHKIVSVLAGTDHIVSKLNVEIGN